MSNAAEVFAEVGRMTDRLDALLRSDAAQKAPAVAKKLRVEKQLRSAIEALKTIVGQLGKATGRLEEPLDKIAALAASCQAIADGLQTFGDGKSIGEMARRCGQSEAMVQPVIDTIAAVRGPLAQVLGFLATLPAASDVRALHDKLQAVEQRLVDPKRVEVDDANAAPAATSPSRRSDSQT
jgi:hypothetical protein